MQAFTIRGVVAAIPTPINADGNPDHSRFVDLARELLASGCDGLNVLGTTGEATSFTVAQRMKLMSAIRTSGLPMDRLIVGTGAAALGDAVALTNHANELGFSASLALPPFYYKGISSDGLLRYFDALANASDELPLLLYNFPAMTGVHYSVEVVQALISALGTRIAGLKDSSGDVPYARSIAVMSDQLAVFPSNEGLLIEARNGAFAGCISATANVNADLCGRAFHAGDVAALDAAVAIRRLFDGKPLVSGVKALTGHLRNDSQISAVLAPLEPISATALQEILAGYLAIRATS